MQRKIGCGSIEHTLARRSFLKGTAAAGGGLLLGATGLPCNAAMQQLDSQQRKILIIFLDGGLSQFESWDPKPGTEHSGPFQTIPTSVPGLHISELLPHTAKQMHHLAVVRSVSTTESDHAPAKYLVETGRNKKEGADFPYLGAAAASKLAPKDLELPPYVIVQTSSYHLGHGGFLGSQYSGVNLPRAKPPRFLHPPEGLTSDDVSRRSALRSLFDQRIPASRRTADTDAYGASYDLAARFARRKDVFDISKESAKQHERYGEHDFGRHCLFARRLLENGVPCVQVRHRAYDSHFENFNIHLETLGEFDRTFATLIDDLYQRGLMESTLVIVMSEMGRTPVINEQLGRDHWPNSWSVVMGGCGIQAGAVHGKTNKLGTEVADGKVNQADLFHTFYQAVGIDSRQMFGPSSKPVPMAEPHMAPLRNC